MDQIYYKQETPDRVIVYFGLRRAGVIKKEEGRFAFFPKASTVIRGDLFPTIQAVKNSLEGKE